MTTVYLVRHCESTGNVGRRIQGAPIVTFRTTENFSSRI
jgi:broad specificity phosphatase PhoE